MSILAKTMEKMDGARLNWYLETQNLPSPAQTGFRRYCSTNQQIVMLSQEIKDSLDRKETLLAVFADFKSAYDSVWRVKLMDKLQKIGEGVECLNGSTISLLNVSVQQNSKITSQNISKLGEDYPSQQSQVPPSLM
jgi:hypothetical protein